MELVLLFFIALVLLGSVLGWTADTRDGADWRQTERLFRPLG